MSGRGGPAVTAYAYPWDIVGDEAAIGRIGELGAQRVALAAGYHGVRAATPQHPRHRVITLESSSLFLPARRGVWGAAPFAPAIAPASAGGPGSFTAAESALRAGGLAVDAWVVLTHFDGASPASLRMKNAWGDACAHALCPSNREVVNYTVRLLTEVIEIGRPDGLIVEAAGPMPFGHAGLHEKTDAAGWNATQRALLSVCFCDGCREAYAANGADADELARRVRTALSDGGHSGTVESALGEGSNAVLLQRAASVRAIWAAVIEVAASAGLARVAFHASADDFPTGAGAKVPEPAVLTRLSGRVEEIELVASGWDSDVAEARLRALSRAAAELPVASFVTMASATPPDAGGLAQLWARLIAAGVHSLHLYHLGIAGAARHRAAADALRDLRTCMSTSPSREKRNP